MKRLIVRSQPLGTGSYTSRPRPSFGQIDEIFAQLRRKLIRLEMMLRDEKHGEEAHDFVVVEGYQWLEPVFEFVAVGNDLRAWRAQKRGEAQRLNTDERYQRRAATLPPSTRKRRKRAR